MTLTKTSLDAGDRVMTPCGKGTINYRRLNPITFEVEAFSVLCDVNAKNPLYSGTIYRAEDVEPLDGENQ
jgi:hypothetical protein